MRALAANFILSFSPKVKVKPNAWTRPRLGYAKLNVDASFDVDSLAGSVGAVLQDHIEKFMAATNERILS